MAGLTGDQLTGRIGARAGDDVGLAVVGTEVARRVVSSKVGDDVGLAVVGTEVTGRIGARVGDDVGLQHM